MQSEPFERLIGLTGGIASGKSVVAQFLMDRGHPVINADHLGHRVLEKDVAFDQIVQTFGPEILDEQGEINRKALGAIVFSDPRQLARLNDISHPRIAQMVQSEVHRWMDDHDPPVIFLEAALLLEAGWHELCRQVWLLVTHPQNAITRLMSRNQLSQQEAQQRLDAQWDNERRLPYATQVFENNGSLEEFLDQVQQYYSLQPFAKV